jgi:RNA-directed DNA polymerase
MEDRVSNDIGVKEPLEDWASIDWKLVLKRVRNLRQRIYRATQNGQFHKVRSLMKLMQRSYSNLLLAIRRVTQENQGKKTAGVDGQTALSLAERVKLIDRRNEAIHPMESSPNSKGVHSKSEWKTKTIGYPNNQRPNSTSDCQERNRT